MPPPTARYLAEARRVLAAEADALRVVADRLDDAFAHLVTLCLATAGRVAVTGIGKSADVGAKLVGTLNSTGTRAFALDATKALHGDLGALHADDVALVLSHSGESDELLRLLGPLGELCSAVAGITGNPNGALARRADVAVVYGPLTEACPLALAPSTSTTAMLALGDALAFCLLAERGFSAEEFARYHPAGSLGRKLARVEQVMRRGPDIRVTRASDPVRAAFSTRGAGGRRTGAVMLVDAAGRLAGIFTDSDLARLFEQRREHLLDRPLRDVMTPDPKTVPVGARVAEAMELLRHHKISELPVVDADGRPVGLLDVTDLIGVPLAAGPAVKPAVPALAPVLRVAS